MVRQRSGRTFLVIGLSTQAVGFQGLERRRRGLFQRNVELLHRRQRFAQFPAQLRRRHCPPRPAPSLWPLRVTCSCASGSPLWQFTAFSPSTYWLPRLAIDPAMYALLPARWQSSRATSGVSVVLAGRVHQLQRCRHFVVGQHIQRTATGSDATLSAVLSVSSKTASPVLLSKSARTMVSLSVKGLARCER